MCEEADEKNRDREATRRRIEESGGRSLVGRTFVDRLCPEEGDPRGPISSMGVKAGRKVCHSRRLKCVPPSGLSGRLKSAPPGVSQPRLKRRAVDEVLQAGLGFAYLPAWLRIASSFGLLEGVESGKKRVVTPGSRLISDPMLDSEWFDLEIAPRTRSLGVCGSAFLPSTCWSPTNVPVRPKAAQNTFQDRESRRGILRCDDRSVCDRLARSGRSFGAATRARLGQHRCGSRGSGTFPNRSIRRARLLRRDNRRGTRSEQGIDSLGTSGTQVP